MNRISNEERARRRQAIRETTLNEAMRIASLRTRNEQGTRCTNRIHDGCEYDACLCTCHDQSDSQYPYRCSVCGQDVHYMSGTMMAVSMWTHVRHSDHQAEAVRKGRNR
ncbi:hypothetical protein ABT282_08555 [Streptomyces sp. NPDC000927]|uniref:hypothetical protein n=1 Tax=Streptomyces sp. NPDC000927 TaxID=3154371 RepID=UPI003317A250